jgi:hypothetical protein
MWRLLPMKKIYGRKRISITALILPVFILLVIIYYIFRPKEQQQELKLIPEEATIDS